MERRLRPINPPHPEGRRAAEAWTWRTATEVIEEAGPHRPVDLVLRARLRGAGGVGPAERRRVARLVFAYYRWRGWGKGGAVGRMELEGAWERQEAFNADPGMFRDEELAERAVPAWTREAMEVRPDWLRSIQMEPRVWLRARAGQGAALAAELPGAKVLDPAHWPDCLVYEGEEDLYQSVAFREGRFELQDFHSQRVGHWCAPKPGETWWDACAGGGGKTLHLSDLMQNKGLIWATDRSARRLDELQRRAARAGVFNLRRAHWPKEEHLPTRTRFDGVLLDAPCAGLGTWDRNPDARWTLRPEDVQELAAIQARLLKRVAPQVKPGGRLVYAVCSLSRAETEEVAASFESAYPEFVPEEAQAPGEDRDHQPGRQWWWPQRNGAVGMFVASWRRQK